MAEEVVTETLEAVKDQVVESVTEAVNGTATKVPASTEGMMVAYGSLVIMALFPIFVGSYRSILAQQKQKETSEKTGEKPESMKPQDAMMFPLIASCALFGLYILFHIFGKEYINMLLSSYFFVLGIFALAHMVSPLILKLIPSAVPVIPFHLKFTQGEGDDLEIIMDYNFNTHDLVCLAMCSGVGIWYILKKHWIANNLLGLAFAVNGVELLHLSNVVTGVILLGGLFFYDIFWVFGTDVMVTVAKSFEAPIKLVFPQDLLVNGLGATNFAMLGLGDIVIPGIFIALLLRYDQSLKRNTNFYFYATFLAYIAGLLTTIFVMHVYKHAQPALLYLVPACLGVPLFLGLVRGDIKSMFSYNDHPEEAETEDKKKDK
jgi:minor histocompatibility antigen H13